MQHTVLSVRQPWAGLLVEGIKRFEVRSWSPPAGSGWLLIHASSSKTPGLRELREYSAFKRALRRAKMVDDRSWIQSAIVGAARFTHFHDTWKEHDIPKRLTENDHMMIGEFPSRFLWRVAECQRFIEPIPCHGRLNLWKTDKALSRQVEYRVTCDMPDYRPWLPATG